MPRINLSYILKISQDLKTSPSPHLFLRLNNQLVVIFIMYAVAVACSMLELHRRRTGHEGCGETGSWSFKDFGVHLRSGEKRLV